jgi:hypothetical protein
MVISNVEVEIYLAKKELYTSHHQKTLVVRWIELQYIIDMIK